MLLAWWQGAHAVSRYSTVHNGFSRLTAQSPRFDIDGDRLIIENGHTTPLLVPDTVLSPTSNYRYMVRMANEHCRPGHRYKAIDPATGKQRKVDAPACGIVFARHGDDYYTATIATTNSHLHDDIMDERTATITVSHIVSGKTTTLWTHTLGERDDINLHDDLNALAVQVKDGMATIMAGRHTLHVVGKAFHIDNSEASSVGIYVGGGGKVAVERTVVSIDQDEHVRQLTPWTIEALNSHFATTIDPMEGFWTYLDRDMDDAVLRLGGRYTIAIVAIDDRGHNYDIIYVAGAQVMGQEWQPAMLKGHLRKTMFAGTYEAQWIDATFLPITQDVQAQVENGVILTLRFPVFHSQLRFAKSLHWE